MALDPGWAGIIGGVVGGVLGTAGTLVSQGREGRLRREERREQYAHEDHVREIDRRREVYANVLMAADDAQEAVGQFGGARHDSDAGLPGLGGAPSVDEAIAAMGEAADRLNVLNTQLELIAPWPVVEASFNFWHAVQSEFDTANHARLMVDWELKIRQFSQMERLELYVNLKAAIREDLGLEA